MKVLFKSFIQQCTFHNHSIIIFVLALHVIFNKLFILILQIVLILIIPIIIILIANLKINYYYYLISYMNKNQHHHPHKTCFGRILEYKLGSTGKIMVIQNKIF